MGQVAGACREAGGQITGIMPRIIAEGKGDDPVAKDSSETVIVPTMHDRKKMMADLADGGFVGLPGGLGTFEEVGALRSTPRDGILNLSSIGAGSRDLDCPWNT